MTSRSKAPKRVHLIPGQKHESLVGKIEKPEKFARPKFEPAPAEPQSDPLKNRRPGRNSRGSFGGL